MLFGFILLTLPLATVGLHLIWPDLLWLKIVAILCVLGSSTFLLSAMEEGIGGAKQFSVPILAIIIVSVAGAFLSIWFGWLSTAVIVGLYGTISIISGFIGRSRIRDV